MIGTTRKACSHNSCHTTLLLLLVLSQFADWLNDGTDTRVDQCVHTLEWTYELCSKMFAYTYTRINTHAHRDTDIASQHFRHLWICSEVSNEFGRVPCSWSACVIRHYAWMWVILLKIHSHLRCMTTESEAGMIIVIVIVVRLQRSAFGWLHAIRYDYMYSSVCRRSMQLLRAPFEHYVWITGGWHSEHNQQQTFAPTWCMCHSTMCSRLSFFSRSSDLWSLCCACFLCWYPFFSCVVDVNNNNNNVRADLGRHRMQWTNVDE